MGIGVTSFNYGSTGTVAVTGTLQTGVIIPTASQTVIAKINTGTGSSQNAYTVTTGKTFYLFGAGMIEASAGVDIYLDDGSTEIMNAGNTASTQSTYNFSPIPIGVYTSGQNVKCTATTGKRYFIYGIEQ